MKTGAEREEALASLNIQIEDFVKAKEHLLKASNYWWWKGWWKGARNARERALNQRDMEKQSAVFRATTDEARATELLRMQGNSYPDDDSVTEAKQLLLDAAEKWQVAGAPAEERRVRDWQKNVKTKAELLASLPVQTWREDPIVAPPVPASAQEQGPDWAKKDQVKSANEFLKSTNQADEKLIHDPIDYQLGQWTTNWGKAFVMAKFFERNLGDRKADLDALADQVGAQKRYTLIEKQKRGGVWWVRVFLYKL